MVEVHFSVPPCLSSVHLALTHPALADSMGPTLATVHGIDGGRRAGLHLAPGALMVNATLKTPEGPYSSIRVLGQWHQDKMVTPVGSRYSEIHGAGLVPAPPAPSFQLSGRALPVVCPCPRFPPLPGFFPGCWGDLLPSQAGVRLPSPPQGVCVLPSWLTLSAVTPSRSGPRASSPREDSGSAGLPTDVSVFSRLAPPCLGRSEGSAFPCFRGAHCCV